MCIQDLVIDSVVEIVEIVYLYNKKRRADEEKTVESISSSGPPNCEFKPHIQVVEELQLRAGRMVESFRCLLFVY